MIGRPSRFMAAQVNLDVNTIWRAPPRLGRHTSWTNAKRTGETCSMVRPHVNASPLRSGALYSTSARTTTS